MDLDELKHGCKVCGKSFPCGRSLGGHMRSHLALNSSGSSMEEAEDEEKLGLVGKNGGYGLRENPKKTRRLSEFSDEEADMDDKVSCSWKYLSDDAEEELVPLEEMEGAEEEEGNKSNSWESNVALLRNGDRPATPPRRRRRSVRVAVIAAKPIEYEKEQEDVALCLMMLSNDTRKWRSGSTGHSKKSVNSSEYYFEDDEAAAATKHSPSKRSRRPAGDEAGFRPEKKTRYECPGCGKAFHSYQALGGHRASHKRINVSCVTRATIVAEPSADMDADDVSDRIFIEPAAKKTEIFECPICYKVFPSGQALGGHKRSHLLNPASSSDDEIRSFAADGRPQQLNAAFLDLNLPAPTDEDC